MNKPMGFIICMMLMGFSFNACGTSSLVIIRGTIICTGDDTLIISGNDTLVAVSDTLKMNHDRKKKRLVSAICAFPFPFGFVGAHRVMLGTKPWIPLVYVATFGGCFGLLPLIDFCVITFSKNLEQYENNPHLFMWVTTKDE